MRPRPARLLAPLATLLLALALAGAAAAQDLGRLLPAETVFALGLRDLGAHADKLDAFVDEFERLGVGDALLALADGGEDAEDAAAAVPEALRELDPLALLGREAWLGVSLSSFNPLPSVTLLARPEPEARAAVAEAIARWAERPDVEAFQEGGATLYVARFDDPDAPVPGAAWALDGELLALSSNPDELRGVLRRAAGAREVGFAGTDAYAATLGRLEPGNAATFVDYGRIATALAPLAAGAGFDGLVERLERAFVTAGASGTVVRVVADGLSSEGVQALNDRGGDLALFLLLTADRPAPAGLVDYVPSGAVSVTVAATDLEAWWNYLDDLVAGAPELGLSGIDEAAGLVGLDLRSGLFDWVVPGTAVITTGVAEVAQPGMPSANLLGETVLVLGAEDEDAARVGLAQLFGTLGQTVAAFADPSGGAGAASTATREVAGTKVTTIAAIPGASLSYAVRDGHALIATSDEAMDAVLTGLAGGGLPPALAGLRGRVPRDAASFTLSDDRATLEGTAQQLSGQLQLAAGLSGGAGLDFDAVEAAARAVEDYLGFVASRLGGSVSHARVEGGAVLRSSHSTIRW